MSKGGPGGHPLHGCSALSCRAQTNRRACSKIAAERPLPLAAGPEQSSRFRLEPNRAGADRHGRSSRSVHRMVRYRAAPRSPAGRSRQHTGSSTSRDIRQASPNMQCLLRAAQPPREPLRRMSRRGNSKVMSGYATGLPDRARACSIGWTHDSCSNSVAS
jgi:hypothetical protein